MGALGYYLELAGLATTQISLIREHTAAIKPPRALWVPFMLGRPFGVPGDAAFQSRVLMAVLRLLEAPSGPVLEDYSEEAPTPTEDELQGVACPVNFGRATLEENDLGEHFLREVEELSPWYDLGRERRGRTSCGLGGLSVEKSADILVSLFKDNIVACLEGSSAGETLKLAVENIRSYYYEAAAARPGSPNAGAIQNWFWHDTAAGRLLLALRRKGIASQDKSIQQTCVNSIVPQEILAMIGNE